MALLSDKNVLWSQLFYQTGVKFGKFYVSLPNVFGLAYLEKQHQENE